MLFIHHYQDSEREGVPPKAIKRIARQLCKEGGPSVTHTRGFVRAIDPQYEAVTTSPDRCGSDYWEIVIEDSGL